MIIGILFHPLPLLFLIFTIVTILILENACYFHASLPEPSFQEALDRAYSQYRASDTYNALINQFSTSQQYSISQLTEVILQHQL
jgi:outer membrane lipoprotein-sorting protein